MSAFVLVCFGGKDPKNRCDRYQGEYALNVCTTHIDCADPKSCLTAALFDLHGRIKPSHIDEILIIQGNQIKHHHKHLSCRYYTCYTGDEDVCSLYRETHKLNGLI
jgi:hypothetical protein